MMVTHSESPARENDIKDLEDALKYNIPSDLLDFYLKFNGGMPTPNAFKHDGDCYIVQWILPIVNTDRGLLWAYETLIDNDVIDRNMIPFADDPNGDSFVYCTSPNSYGSIKFIQSDYYDEPDRYVIELAPNLREFFSSLVLID